MQYPTIAQPQYGFGPTMPPGMYDTPPALMNFKDGGMTSSAQRVQNQGRGEDTMLVHMTPREVAGLQALAMAHGGSLTINPQTGLPEAGFLKNLLPTLVGAALTIGSGGVINPATAGMIVGGIETARTGDIGKGFLAGLGAFGGAGMGTGLQSAGTAANAANAAKTATTATNTLGAADIASAGLGDPGVATQTLGAGSTLQPLVQTPSTTMLGAGSNVGEAAATALTPTQQLTTGFKSVFDTGPTGQAARDAFMGKVGGYGGLATKAGMAAAPALLAQPDYSMPAPKEEESNYEGPYTPSERRVSYPGDDERRRSSEFTYFAPSNPVPFEHGGLASLARGGSVPQLEDGGFVLTKKAVDGLGRGSNKKGQENARRGLGAIPIKGPGTGTSDSIKTNIDGKRPALVSNGEAYVPKRQVAKRGGAKAFYALMNKAEKAADRRKRA